MIQEEKIERVSQDTKTEIQLISSFHDTVKFRPPPPKFIYGKISHSMYKPLQI